MRDLPSFVLRLAIIARSRRSLLLRLPFRMCRDLAILAWAGWFAATDVVHLLRLQRTSWMLLHRLLPLRERRVLRRSRVPGHQRTAILRRSTIRTTAIIRRTAAVIGTTSLAHCTAPVIVGNRTVAVTYRAPPIIV